MTDHRAAAEAALAASASVGQYIADIRNQITSTQMANALQAASATGSQATAYALLALVDSIDRMVEQQHIATLLMAYNTGLVDADVHTGLRDTELRAQIVALVERGAGS